MENAVSAEIALHPALPFAVEPHGPAPLGAQFLPPENEAFSAQPGLPRTTQGNCERVCDKLLVYIQECGNSGGQLNIQSFWVG